MHRAGIMPGTNARVVPAIEMPEILFSRAQKR